MVYDDDATQAKFFSLFNFKYTLSSYTKRALYEKIRLYKHNDTNILVTPKECVKYCRLRPIN